MGSQESGKLVVQAEAVGRNIVIEPDLPAAGIAGAARGISTPIWAVDICLVVLQPGIKPFSPDAPMAVERILEADTADPAPTPIITSPFCVIENTGSTIIAGEPVITPGSMRKRAAGGHIQKSLVVQE